MPPISIMPPPVSAPGLQCSRSSAGETELKFGFGPHGPWGRYGHGYGMEDGFGYLGRGAAGGDEGDYRPISLTQIALALMPEKWSNWLTTKFPKLKPAEEASSEGTAATGTPPAQKP